MNIITIIKGSSNIFIRKQNLQLKLTHITSSGIKNNIKNNIQNIQHEIQIETNPDFINFQENRSNTIFIKEIIKLGFLSII